MSNTSRRSELLKKLKKGNITSAEKTELISLLKREKKIKEKSDDVWGLLVLAGLLYFLSKK